MLCDVNDVSIETMTIHPQINRCEIRISHENNFSTPSWLCLKGGCHYIHHQARAACIHVVSHREHLAIGSCEGAERGLCTHCCKYMKRASLPLTFSIISSLVTLASSLLMEHSLSSLTLGAHAQRGLVCVCVCVCLLLRFLPPRAIGCPISDISGFSAIRKNGVFSKNVSFQSYGVIFLPRHSPPPPPRFSDDSCVESCMAIYAHALLYLNVKRKRIRK